MDSKITNKERYRELCNENNDIPLFMQAWWMDAVCFNKKWDVIFYEKNHKIIAVWVYHYVKKFGITAIIQPQLTQTNGIWIESPTGFSKNKILSYETEIMKNLITQFESLEISYFDQNFHYSFTNWLPFYWKGFTQTTRYTYIIEDISNHKNCFEEFRNSKKSHIKKAEKSIFIDQNLSWNEFYDHLQQNLIQNKKQVYYSKEFFSSLYHACVERNQGCILAAYDSDKNFHAGLFVVWDNKSAYNLISTINPTFRSSGASSLLFCEAIKLMSNKTKTFDFEGSMNEKIEKSFREFGTIQVPYFQLKKTSLPSLEKIKKSRQYFSK